MKAAGKTARHLAREVAVSEGHLGRVLRGERQPSKDLINRLADAVGAVAESLRNQPDRSRPAPELSEYERLVVAVMRSCGDESRGMIIGLALALSRTGGRADIAMAVSGIVGGVENAAASTEGPEAGPVGPDVKDP